MTIARYKGLIAIAAVTVITGSVSAYAVAQQPAGAVPALKAANTTQGEAAFHAWCGSCHDNGGVQGAPATESLRGLSKANIRYTLELGYMKQQARLVPPADLQAIIDWLPNDPQSVNGWVDKAMCTTAKRRVDLSPRATRSSISFGITPNNNRSLTTAQSGLTKADMANLEPSWVIAFPQTVNMRSQPIVVGTTVFIAATDPGYLYALDTRTGCVKWSYGSEMTLRSSLTFAEAAKGKPAMILMGDAGGFIHAVNATNGQRVWRTDVKLTDLNRITGAPMVAEGKVIAPLSAIEVNYASPDFYECCRGQGAVVALDLATGRKLWTGRTMPDATKQQLSRTGTQQWGPSGAIIWSSPVIDLKRHLIYVGTGENTSWPPTDTSDSIIAYDLNTGERKWVFQATKSDIWNYACGGRAANCDFPGEYQSPDFDFGATSMLVKTPDGRELVIGPQKSGALWALNPDTGALVWSNKIGRGSAGGGIRWGIAYDGTRIFAPLNDGQGTGGSPNWGPGMHAVNANTGEIEWSYKPNARDCGADLPVAAATRPTPENRMLHIDAPMMPPPRAPAAAAGAGRGGAAGAAGRGGAAPARGGAAAPAAAVGEGAAPAAGRGGAGRGGGTPCRVGMSPAPLLIDNAVVTGTNGGMLRIFDNVTGAVLFEYQTNKAWPNTVNGVVGKGGALDSAPYAAGDGALFVESGYARFGEPPGNVLIAFRPKRR